MSLTDLAEGIFLKIAAIVCIAGFALRVVLLLARRGGGPCSKPRNSLVGGAALSCANWLIPKPGFLRRNPIGGGGNRNVLLRGEVPCAQFNLALVQLRQLILGAGFRFRRSLRALGHGGFGALALQLHLLSLQAKILAMLQGGKELGEPLLNGL